MYKSMWMICCYSNPGDQICSCKPCTGVRWQISWGQDNNRPLNTDQTMEMNTTHTHTHTFVHRCDRWSRCEDLTTHTTSVRIPALPVLPEKAEDIKRHVRHGEHANNETHLNWSHSYRITLSCYVEGGASLWQVRADWRLFIFVLFTEDEDKITALLCWT